MITKRRPHRISISHSDGRSYPGSCNSGGRSRGFSEAGIFFELNDTEGDLGIHSSIDGGAYSRLTITDPRRHTILNVGPRAAGPPGPDPVVF